MGRRLAPDDPRHGTLNGYNNLGCRCQPCRDARAAHQQAYRNRYVADKLCLTAGCEYKADRAYLTGFCHRCNMEMGLKPERVA